LRTESTKKYNKERRTHVGLLDDPPRLAEDGAGDEHLLADQGVVLVVGVVGVAKLAVGAELELEELVAELALVPHVIPQVELVVAAARRHCYTHDDLLRLLFWFFPSQCFLASGSGGWVSSRNALTSSYYLFLSCFSSYIGIGPVLSSVWAFDWGVGLFTFRAHFVALTKKPIFIFLLAKVLVRCDGLSTFIMLLLMPPVLISYIRNCLAQCMVVTLSRAKFTVDS